MVFSPGDLIRQNPEFLTGENMGLLRRAQKAWDDGSSAKERIVLYQKAANTFTIPNEHRLTFRQLYRVVQQLYVVAERAWEIKQRGLKEGMLVFDPTQVAEVPIKGIRRDFRLRVEGRRYGVSPDTLLPLST